MKPEATFEFYTSLPDDVEQAMWDQGVCMDDWDYLLFFEDGFETWMDESYKSRRFTCEILPKDYELGRLLTGCCYNKWYPVTDFAGRKGIVGVAYHA